MKVPLRYQNTEYDCGTTSFINALAYLYDREDIPVELLKAIHKFTLDVKGSDGVTGKGGTSRKHAELLVDYFADYAQRDDNFNIWCTILRGEDVSFEAIRETLRNGGVAIAYCWQSNEHYVLITKMDDMFTYIFDPYYFEKDYYNNDEDVAMVFHEEFTHNRIVKTERLFSEEHKDFSLMEKHSRLVILLNKR